MTMTRAELAQALHGIALLLENDSAFHNAYVLKNRDAMTRRTCIWTYVQKLGTDAQVRLCQHDKLAWFVSTEYAGREYLRRYFDMRWDRPEPSSNVFWLPDFEFWLDAEQWPDQIRAGEPRPSTQPQPQPTQDITMLAITTKTLINGVDIADKTNDQLFDAIAQAEAEIAKLQAISAKPKALVAKINELQAGIAALVAHMDSKV